MENFARRPMLFGQRHISSVPSPRPAACGEARTVLGLCCLVTLSVLAVPSAAGTQAAPTGDAGTVNVAVTASEGSSSANGGENRGAPMRLTPGKVRQVPFPKGATYQLASGADLVRIEEVDGSLHLTALKPGRATLTVSSPEMEPVSYDLRIGGAGAAGAMEPAAPSVTPATEPAANAGPSPAPVPTANAAPLTATAPSTSPLPPLGPPVAQGVPSGLQPLEPSARLTPALRLPAPLPDVNFALPSPAQRRAAEQTRPRNTITVTQGLARLLSFSNNILSVYFSDANVMDARAINARTLAITGLGVGRSTLAIFTARNASDAIGSANVYQVIVEPVTAPTTPSQPEVSAPATADAIRAALNDPRIGVNVVQLPSGGLVVRLTGAVRNAAESQEAVDTAKLFYPQVNSAIYVDPSALTRDDAARLATEGPASIPTTPVTPAPPRVLSPEEVAEANLRQITGNQSIRLLPLGNGLIVQAEVGSPIEADNLLRLTSSLNQKTIPMIVVRGAPGIYTQSRAIRTEEDEEMTRRLQEVTGISSVYVSRTAKNGLAVYGDVRNRAEYERVRRYAVVLPQLEAGTGSETLQASMLGRGNTFPSGIQIFVRILDPAANSVRLVTVETNVVEIARNALKNLGVEFGSATLLSETRVAPTGPATTITTGPNGTTTTTTPGTLGSVTRTIDPTFRQGVALAGNGFIGLGPNRILDPLRVRLNALYQSGNADILSAPNLTVVEGADAQIIIGGRRPIPDVTTSTGAGGGAINTQFIFRPFGIILKMRPTVMDDDTIVLQIRADVTDLDFATGVNFQGSLVPGERVRSVDTVLTVREGDIFVMGGLITNERREQTSRVPVLSSIPIIGKLFQSRRFENNQTELALFMQPRIKRLPVTPETFNLIPNIPSLPELPIDEQPNPIVNIGSSGTGR